MDKISVAIVLLLMIAGCSIPATDGDETTTQLANTTSDEAKNPPHSPTQTPERDIIVSGNSLSVNADLVFNRVENIMGEEVAPPNSIRVLDAPPASGEHRIASTFEHRMGIRNATFSGGRATGFTRTPRTVHLYPANASEREIQRVLAHEFAHVIQYRSDAYRMPSATQSTTDNMRVRGALFEGGASYVSTLYTTRHLPTVESDIEIVRKVYTSGNVGEKYRLAPYYYGFSYIDNRTERATGLQEIYQNPPTTTEQLLHNLSAGQEPPKNLTVESDDDGANWSIATSDTLGELSLRLILQSEIPSQRAKNAAAGWGNDRLLQYSTPSSSEGGYVWVITVDSSRDADELEGAFRNYISERTNNSTRKTPHEELQMTRTNDDTVVIFTGPRTFVSKADAVSSRSTTKIIVKSSTGQ